MIADRNPLIVRHQGLVGAEQFAHIGGVVDRGVKIGVVANLRGYAVHHIGLCDQTLRPRALDVRFGGAAQATRERQTQGRPCVSPHCHEFVQCGCAGGAERLQSQVAE